MARPAAEHLVATRWLTFDWCGRLVGWRQGIGRTGEVLFPGRGAEVLGAYIEIEAEVEKEKPFRRYRVVLAETLRRAAASLQLDLKHDDATALTSTIPHWPVFADVGPALRALHADEWKLALLTNCDRDLIALTERRLPEPFDAVVTAEDVSAYKPDHAHFQRFESVFGGSANAWIHVAQSYYHAIRPATEPGIRRIWVNRPGARDHPALADAVVTGLAELREAVTRLAAAPH